jgi:hypothetical protein
MWFLYDPRIPRMLSVHGRKTWWPLPPFSHLLKMAEIKLFEKWSYENVEVKDV